MRLNVYFSFAQLTSYAFIPIDLVGSSYSQGSCVKKPTLPRFPLKWKLLFVVMFVTLHLPVTLR